MSRTMPRSEVEFMRPKGSERVPVFCNNSKKIPANKLSEIGFEKPFRVGFQSVYGTGRGTQGPWGAMGRAVDSTDPQFTSSGPVRASAPASDAVSTTRPASLNDGVARC